MVAPIGSSGSSSSSNAAAQAAAAAAAAAARAEAIRRQLEAARKAAEAARKAAEAAAKAKAEAAKAAAAAKKAAAAKPSPDANKKTLAAEKAAASATKIHAAAEAKQQAAEEQVTLLAKKATTQMREANKAAVAEKKPTPYAKKDLVAAAATKVETAAAFDGTKRSAELASKLDIKAPTASAVTQTLAAQDKLTALKADPAASKALDTLGIKNPSDLVALGDRLERQLKTGETSKKFDGAIRSVTDADALNKVLAGAAETRIDAATKKTLADPYFTARLQEGDSPRDAKIAAEVKADFKLSDRETTQLLRNTSARGAAKTLFNPESTPEQRTTALLGLTGPLQQAVSPERYKKVLQDLGGSKDLATKLNTHLPVLKNLVGGIDTLTNPDASALDKSKAALNIATSLKTELGVKLPELAPALRKLDGPARLISAGLTVLDPNAKPEDRAMAALSLAGEARGAWRDLKGLGQALRDAKVPNPDAILKDASSLADRTLGDLPADVASKLSGSQVSELARAESLGLKPDDFKKVLTTLDAAKPGGLDEVLKHVNASADGTEAKKFLSAVGSLDPKVMGDVLADPQAVDKLASLAKKMPLDVSTDHLADVLKTAKNPADLNKLISTLDGQTPENANKLAKALKGLEPAEVSKLLANEDGLKDFAKVTSKLDGEALTTFSKLAKNMDAAGLADLSKYAAKADGDVIEKLMKGAGPILEKMDGRALGEVANALSKGLSAIGGLLGKMGVELTGDVAAKVLKNVSKMVPVLGAIPGFVDAALLTKESADLYGKNKDLSMLALTGAKLNALDSVAGLVLDATGVGVAVDLGVGVGFGIAELALDIGLSKEKAKMEAADKNGTEYEAPGWVKGVNIAAAALQGPSGVAEYIAFMGPKKAFEDAKWALGQGGKLADKAWDLIKAAGGKFVEYAAEAVEALKNAGEWGVDKLEDLAGGVGDLANAAKEQAQEALKDVARAGGEAAKKAAEAINTAVNAGAEWAKDAAVDLLKDGVGAMKDIAKTWANGLNDGTKAVIDGLHGLGEGGVEALKDLSSLGGDVADYTVGKLKNLAKDGIGAAKDALGALGDLGGKVGGLAKDALDGLGGLVSSINPFD